MIIVTIDGPAGAGKSTVARGLAARLGYLFLDTGAMYRAATYAVMQSGDLQNQESRITVTNDIQIDVTDGVVLINGEDVSRMIRTAEVTNNIHFLADDPLVRSVLVERQRAIAEGQNVVTEGRDQGTVAFPDAEFKIFLTASPEERARRRQTERSALGEDVTVDEMLAAQNIRDKQDEMRPVGALQKAADAVEVVTDGMTIEKVIACLEKIVSKK